MSIEKQSLTIHRYKHHKATSKQQILLLERPPLHGVLSYCVCVAVKSLVRCHIYLSMTKLLLRRWLCKQLALAVKSLVVQLPCLLLLERPPLHGVLSYCVCVAVKSLVRCHIYLFTDFIKQNTSHILKLLEITKELVTDFESSKIYQAKKLKTKTYNCRACDRLFENSASLASHRSKYHRINSTTIFDPQPAKKYPRLMDTAPGLLPWRASTDTQYLAMAQYFASKARKAKLSIRD